MPLSRLPPIDTYFSSRTIREIPVEKQKEVLAPRFRKGMPCDVKNECKVAFCRERTSDVCPHGSKACMTPNCHECTLIKCEKDCERRRFKHEPINIKICKNGRCQKLVEDRRVLSCSRFMAEVKNVHRTPFNRDPVIRQRGKVGQGFWYRKV
jgi:hypothetical protein